VCIPQIYHIVTPGHGILYTTLLHGLYCIYIKLDIDTDNFGWSNLHHISWLSWDRALDYNGSLLNIYHEHLRLSHLDSYYINCIEKMAQRTLQKGWRTGLWEWSVSLHFLGNLAPSKILDGDLALPSLVKPGNNGCLGLLHVLSLASGTVDLISSYQHMQIL
jgi:hypothetical protein